MTSGIPPIVEKLIPRLASDFDGEVVATARAIDRALRANGRDWHDVACGGEPPILPKTRPQRVRCDRCDSETLAELQRISKQQRRRLAVPNLQPRGTTGRQAVRAAS
jgi:hypothetical protein